MHHVHENICSGLVVMMHSFCTSTVQEVQGSILEWETRNAQCLCNEIPDECHLNGMLPQTGSPL